MKLLAQKNLNIIKNYVSYKMYSPCEKCSTLEKLSCCGCMKMISYVNTNKESLINYNSLITISCEKPTPLGVGWIAI